MHQAIQGNPGRSAKLVKLLSEYQLSNIEVNYHNFAERLGLLVDLSDSVALSESLRAIPKMSYDIRHNIAEFCPDDLPSFFLNQRAIILKSILKSFDFNAVFVQFKLPVPTAETPVSDALNFDQYQRFYLLHQSELDFKIEKIRSSVQKKMSAYSLNLSKLAALDKTISQSMSLHTRKHFSMIPRFLKTRFEELYADYSQKNIQNNDIENPSFWLTNNGWLSQFYSEMQQLLLAEFEVRLQPVIGLVEAYNEELEKQL